MKETETQTQTRKDEVKYRTSTPDGAIGMFLAAPVMRTWQEDLVDAETGELTTIDRSEILYKKGTFIDPSTAQSLKFHLLAGDFEDIEVSNQRRMAQPYDYRRLRPFRVKAEVGDKKHTLLLEAQSASKAIEVATDYIELNFTQSFDILQVKALDNVVVLNNRLLTPEEAAADAEAGTESEEKREDVTHYKVETKIDVRDNEDGSTFDFSQIFIVVSKDVDTAKSVITAYLTKLYEDQRQVGKTDRNLEGLAIISAVAFSCNQIIDEAFCQAYMDKAED